MKIVLGLSQIISPEGKNAWIFTSEQTKTADFIAKCLFRGKILRFFASENTMLEFLLVIGEFETVFVASEVAEKSAGLALSSFFFISNLT